MPPGDSLPRWVCDQCGEIHYQNPRLVVGTIPEYEGKLLLCRRAIEPRYGYWTLPAGFMENGETTGQAALRETLEEAGAQRRARRAVQHDLGAARQPGAPLLPRAAARPGLQARRGNPRGRAVRGGGIPWKDIAFRTVGLTLKHWFADRGRGAFGFHAEDLTVKLPNIRDRPDDVRWSYAAKWHGIRMACVMLLRSARASASPADRRRLDPANTAWMLTASVLVLFMTLPGLALFYAGLVRTKNVLSVLMQCFAITCMVTLAWVVVGYSIAFGDGGPNAWCGGFGKAFLAGIDVKTVKGSIPETVFAMYQMTFAIITPALVIGAYAERVQFSGMLLFSLLWLLIVYCPVAHWVWGDGWLQKMGLMDFAGGTVVHLNAGMAALVCALVLGRRRGFPETAMPPHNMTMVVTGACMLWVGWFGFNAGSALAADGAAGMAMLVTHIGAATGALAWMVCEWLRYGKPSVLGIVTGMVAGLGTITPASGFVGPIGALAIGGAAGVVCFFATSYMKRALNDRRLARRLPGARRRRHPRHAADRRVRLRRLRRHRLSRQGRPWASRSMVQLIGVLADRRLVGRAHLGAAQAARRGGRHARCERRGNRGPRHGAAQREGLQPVEAWSAVSFLKFCAAAARPRPAAAPALAADARPQLYYARPAGRRRRASRCARKAIPANRNLIFHYPYAVDALLPAQPRQAGEGSAQLKTADNAAPTSGTAASAPARSIVAYSAICAHQLTYPTRDISFISFRAEKSARNRHRQRDPLLLRAQPVRPGRRRRACSPARRRSRWPRSCSSTIAKTDEIHAVGTLGGEMFNEFFAKYEFRLALEHGGAPRRPVAGTRVVHELDNYCKQQVKC